MGLVMKCSISSVLAFKLKVEQVFCVKGES